MNLPTNMAQDFNAFTQNPMQYLISHKVDIPQNLQNDPHQAVQYLLNNGQMQQNTFNNITRFCQSIGIRLF